MEALECVVGVKVSFVQLNGALHFAAHPANKRRRRELPQPSHSLGAPSHGQGQPKGEPRAFWILLDGSLERLLGQTEILRRELPDTFLPVIFAGTAGREHEGASKKEQSDSSSHES